MELDGYFQLGTITRTHGIKGNVIIRLDVDQPAAYRKLKAAFLLVQDKLTSFSITSTTINGDQLNVHLGGVEDMNAAEELVNTAVFLSMDQLPALKGKQLYFHEAVGMLVTDVTEGNLGTIQKVYDLPEQPLASVDFNGKELLFPLISEFIERVDRGNRVLYVKLPPGLTDIYR